MTGCTSSRRAKLTALITRMRPYSCSDLTEIVKDCNEVYTPLFRLAALRVLVCVHTPAAAFGHPYLERKQAVRATLLV